MTGLLQQYEFLATIEIPLQVITAISLLLRLVTKAFILKRFTFDDYVIIPAWMTLLGTYITYLLVLHSIKRLLVDGHFDLAFFEKSIKGAAICYTLCMTLVKLALGAWFYQIFRVHRLQRVTIIITVGATMVFGVTNTIASAVTCGPSAGLLGPIADCPIWPVYSGISLSWSVLNAIGDIIMAVLAVNALWSARMPLNTKIVASLILVLGTFGGVASVARLWIIAENHGRPGGSSGIKIGMWTGIEPCAGIAAANFACLRPMLSLLKRQFLRVRGMVTPQASAASGSAAAAAAAAAPKFPSLRRPRAFRSPNSTTTLTAEYAAEWELQYDNKSRMGSVSGAPLVVTEIPLEDQRVEHEHGVEQEGLELVHPGTRVMGVLPDDLEDMEITEPEPEHSDRL